MALVANRQQQAQVPMNGNGRVFVWGTFKFSGTDASGKLPLPSLYQLESLVITPCGTPASDEVVSGPANPSPGLLKVPVDGVTVTRTGAVKTADLVCSYFGVGY